MLFLSISFFQSVISVKMMVRAVFIISLIYFGFTDGSTLTYKSFQSPVPDLVSKKCLGCICNVESGCKPLPCKKDGPSLSCGYFQIKENYWKDCGRPGGSWKICAENLKCSILCVQNYMRRYIGFSGCARNCESYARIHNGGPKGCKSPSTLKYWQAIMRQGCNVNS